MNNRVKTRHTTTIFESSTAVFCFFALLFFRSFFTWILSIENLDLDVFYFSFLNSKIKVKKKKTRNIFRPLYLKRSLIGCRFICVPVPLLLWSWNHTKHSFKNLKPPSSRVPPSWSCVSPLGLLLLLLVFYLGRVWKRPSHTAPSGWNGEKKEEEKKLPRCFCGPHQQPNIVPCSLPSLSLSSTFFFCVQVDRYRCI